MIAIIGGSGFEVLPDVVAREAIDVQTPYGAPSDKVKKLHVGGQTILFLSRHGSSHRIAPHNINYRANIWALHHLGARQVIGLNAVGIVDAAVAPGGLVIPDQLIDYSHGRESTFFDGQMLPLKHIEFDEPYTQSMRESLLAAGLRANVEVVDGGVMGVTQGPRLETRAEVDRLERDGVRIVGMTGAPEAELARELALEYACLGLVVNHAAGRAKLGIHEQFEQSMNQARDNAYALVHNFLEKS